jgi:hypothetical protein
MGVTAKNHAGSRGHYPRADRGCFRLRPRKVFFSEGFTGATGPDRRGRHRRTATAARSRAGRLCWRCEARTTLGGSRGQAPNHHESGGRCDPPASTASGSRRQHRSVPRPELAGARHATWSRPASRGWTGRRRNGCVVDRRSVRTRTESRSACRAVASALPPWIQSSGGCLSGGRVDTAITVHDEDPAPLDAGGRLLHALPQSSRPAVRDPGERNGDCGVSATKRSKKTEAHSVSPPRSRAASRRGRRRCRA